MGMPAIAERGEPEPPQDDLAIAQARVDALEVKLKAA